MAIGHQRGGSGEGHLLLLPPFNTKMKPFGLPTMLRALAIAALMAARGLKKKSLTVYGAFAAFLVGFLSISCGPRGFLLLLFYLVRCIGVFAMLLFALAMLKSIILSHHISLSQVATKATKYKSQIKSKLDQSSADSSCRGPGQVLACSVLGVTIQLVHVYYFGEEKSIGEATLYYCICSLVIDIIVHHDQLTYAYPN